MKSNEQIKKSGSQSAASYSLDLGNISYSTMGTSVHLFVSVASTGANSGWTNFQGGSPVTVIDTDIGCPAANPNFTAQPTVSVISETQVSLTCGSTDIASNMYYKVDSQG